MSKTPLFAAAVAVLLAAAPAAWAQSQGTVTKINRPKVATFDANGAPLGQVASSEFKLPAPVVGMGKGNSVGLKHGGRTVYLRGLDVVTTGMKVACKPAATVGRQAGSSYAATQAGLGGAADCSK